MRRLVPACLVALLLASATAVAQEVPERDEPVDIDDLFGDPPPEGEESEQPSTQDSESPVLSRLLESDPVRLEVSGRVVAGYSPGWSAPLGSPGTYEDLPIVDLSSRIDLAITVSERLRISHSFAFAYPEYELAVKELALDYSVAEAAYVTLGLRRVVWGRSPSFPFANIIQREADEPLGPAESTGTIVARVQLPLGVGGFEFLAQNKARYQPDPDSPDPERIGFGAKYNFAHPAIDLDAGAYYQAGLHGRLFVSGTTTVADWLELYGEAVAADARLRLDDTGDYEANPDFGASLGVIVGLWENNVDLNAEYYYNGEETENGVAGASFPLFWGHNVAANADVRFPDSPFRLRAGYRHNIATNSGLVAPRLTVNLMRHVTLDLVGGLFWGEPDEGYRAHNPDPLDRPAFLTVTLSLHGGT